MMKRTALDETLDLGLDAVIHGYLLRWPERLTGGNCNALSIHFSMFSLRNRHSDFQLSSLTSNNRLCFLVFLTANCGQVTKFWPIA